MTKRHYKNQMFIVASKGRRLKIQCSCEGHDIMNRHDAMMWHSSKGVAVIPVGFDMKKFPARLSPDIVNLSAGVVERLFGTEAKAKAAFHSAMEALSELALTINGNGREWPSIRPKPSITEDEAVKPMNELYRIVAFKIAHLNGVIEAYEDIKETLEGAGYGL
jgi:hypothetical protein